MTTKRNNEAEWQRVLLKMDLYSLLSTVTKDDYLLLTGDEDSVLCAILFAKIVKRVRNINIKVGAFFDFGNDYSIISYVDEPIPDENLICCDCSLIRGFLSDRSHIRTIDNHVFKLTKDDNYRDRVFTLNLNEGISLENYYSKSATSSAWTLLTAYGDHSLLYDGDKTSYSVLQQKILMSIDGMFSAVCKRFDAYEALWRDMWQVEEYLNDVMHYDFKTFKNIQRELNLKGGECKMYVNKEGKLTILDNSLDFLNNFELDRDFIKHIKQLRFKTFIPYERFNHSIADGEKCTIDSLQQQYGEIVNIAVTDGKTIKGCTVCEHSYVHYYNDKERLNDKI